MKVYEEMSLAWLDKLFQLFKATIIAFNKSNDYEQKYFLVTEQLTYVLLHIYIDTTFSNLYNR